MYVHIQVQEKKNAFFEFELPLSGNPDEKFNYVGQVNHRVQNGPLDLLYAIVPNGHPTFGGSNLELDQMQNMFFQKDVNRSQELNKISTGLEEEFKKGNFDDMYDSDDEAFEDARADTQQTMFLLSSNKQGQKILMGGVEPLERSALPWLKDPKVKVSLWAIIKDSVGKDISKITVPVYFNDPSSLLQKCAQSCEYNYLLDQAVEESDSLKRLALVAIHQISAVAICERTTSKPFNPLLGETYELVTQEFQYLSEQVSHHPPVSACYCKGKAYTYWTNQKTNSKFTGKSLCFLQQYRAYIDLEVKGQGQERYEIILPTLSVHNLIFGSPYVDIGEKMIVRNLSTKEYATCDFTRRGWFAKDNAAFRVDGSVYSSATTQQSSKKDKLDTEAFPLKGGKECFKIAGHWNDKVTIQKSDQLNSTPEVIWQKRPYPEQWDWMYGMSHFSLQLNYFPSWLHNTVAPTDTRRRPDQRALENGDMEIATICKDHLESKQRAVRKHNETKKIEHKCSYFDTWDNPTDKQTYWVYNEKYFESDRPKQNWSRLPDIFSNNIDPEIVQYMPKNYKQSSNSDQKQQKDNLLLEDQ